MPCNKYGFVDSDAQDLILSPMQVWNFHLSYFRERLIRMKIGSSVFVQFFKKIKSTMSKFETFSFRSTLNGHVFDILMSDLHFFIYSITEYSISVFN